MNLSEAKAILDQCVRSELRDHAFGDREVYWEREGSTVAEGYFGSGTAVVGVNGPPDAEGQLTTLAEFEGAEALELSRCGRRGQVERNDSTGPDQYAEGRCMPGLTLEGVLQELCGTPPPPPPPAGAVQKDMRELGQQLRQLVGDRLFEAMRHLIDLKIDGVDIDALPDAVWNEIAEFRRVLVERTSVWEADQLTGRLMSVRVAWRAAVAAVV